MEAIRIGVGPDRVAQPGRFVKTQIPRRVILPRRQRRRHRLACLRVRIAVRRIVAAHIPRAGRIARRHPEADKIVARHQVREGVDAAGVRRRRQQRGRSDRIVEHDRHALHAGLPDILEAIRIGVGPDRVTQPDRQVKAHIQIRVAFIDPQGVVHLGRRRRQIAVAHFDTDILERWSIPRRGLHGDCVRAQVQIVEAVVAVRIGRRRHDLSGPVGQREHDTGHP